jgi:hypothetical protein
MFSKITRKSAHHIHICLLSNSSDEATEFYIPFKHGIIGVHHILVSCSDSDLFRFVLRDIYLRSERNILVYI